MNAQTNTMASLLATIAKDEESARTHDMLVGNGLNAELHSEAAQRADERAEEGRKAARELFTQAFPGVDPSDFARKVGL